VTLIVRGFFSSRKGEPTIAILKILNLDTFKVFYYNNGLANTVAHRSREKEQLMRTRRGSFWEKEFHARLAVEPLYIKIV
jgi:hypothetical protein